jgi:putative transposase
VWQKRFWEHQVRDESDLNRCFDYIHFNPVRHGLARCPHAWEWSSFHRCVREARYDVNWLCACDPSATAIKQPAEIPGAEMDL